MLNMGILGPKYLIDGYLDPQGFAKDTLRIEFEVSEDWLGANPFRAFSKWGVPLGGCPDNESFAIWDPDSKSIKKAVKSCLK